MNGSNAETCPFRLRMANPYPWVWGITLLFERVLRHQTSLQACLIVVREKLCSGFSDVVANLVLQLLL